MIEKVNPMHPDKIADRIAGAMVDLAYKKQNNPRVAIEVLIGHNKSIYFSNQDYRKVEIPEGAIVYCDIPYENTGKYAIGDFDYDAFYKWVDENKNKYKIFISSYALPEDKFEEVWSVDKTCKMAKNSNKKTIEPK